MVGKIFCSNVSKKTRPNPAPRLQLIIKYQRDGIILVVKSSPLPTLTGEFTLIGAFVFSRCYKMKFGIFLKFYYWHF